MSKLNILVIDDATFIRDLIKKNIRDHFPNVTLHEALDGKKAQAQLRSNTFDLILCDWEMPEMNGEELCIWLREQEQHKSTPFVMVTSRGEREHIVKAIQAGVSDYLTKPFNNDQLIQKIQKALHKSGKLTQAAQRNVVMQNAVAAESVSILTGGKPAAKPSAQPQAASAFAAKPAAAPAAKPATIGKLNPKGKIQLRFADRTCGCILKDINLKEMVAVIKREDWLPAVLQMVSVDIEEDGTERVERINGFLHTVQSAENSIDTRFFNLNIRFVDDDPKKMEFLTHFIQAAQS